MPGQLDNLKSRKRKSSSQVSAVGLKIQRKHSPAEQGSVLRSGKVMDPLQKRSHIICECQRSSDSRRCSASPELDGQEGKENELRTEREMDSCRGNGSWDKPERVDCAESFKISFPDDDSNEILPVEQFFGNLDVVQDFPIKTLTSAPDVQKENRRRHFYAREDSDEEANFSSVRPDKEEDT